MIERRISPNRNRAGFPGLKNTSSLLRDQLGLQPRMAGGDDMIAGRYRLESVIGRGGMGYIYRAVDTYTDEIVALKKLKPELIQKDPQLLPRFQREGLLQEALSHHPHVVSVIERINHADGHFIVMEYIDGGTLEERLPDEGPLPLEEALQITVPLAGALVQAHAQDIIHRDLKPGNILLTRDGEPKLTDFGTAFIEHHTRLTQAGTIIGTYAYMSPEVCNGTEIDERTDIWSFGVMLYEMVTGRLPFYHENPMHLMLAIMREPPDDIQMINPDVPDHLAELIYRMLTKDKHLRIPKMSLVHAELEHILKFGLKSTGVPSNIKALGFIPQRLYRFPIIPPIVGRIEEIEQVDNLLFNQGSQLVSIIGPGGVGKTHLGIHLGHTLQNHFLDGAHFTDLSGVEDPVLMISSIANGLKFHFFGKEEADVQLYNYLANKELLLVLDNVESPQVINPIIRQILTRAPRVRLIVTAREPLYLREEWQVPLSGLSTPGSEVLKTGDFDDCPACHLFVQTARRSRADYKPEGDEKHYIAAICRVVGGLPLAIELAAGWIGTLSAEEILEELRGDLGILETDLRDVPSRHRSIRAVYEHAWKQLGEAEQEALQSMSIFAGGFERRAVQEVVGANLAVINSLVNKSLLKRSPDDGLYRAQELLRRFAAERLSRSPQRKVELRSNHAQYYLRDMQARAALLRGGDQLDALQRIDLTHDNIRLAVQWALADSHLKLLGGWLEAMYYYYVYRGRQKEGYESYSEVARQLPLAVQGKPNILVTKAMARQGALGAFVNYGEISKKQLWTARDQARVFEDEAELAFILTRLCEADRGNSELGAWAAEARAIGERLERLDLAADAANWQAYHAYMEGAFDRALTLLDESLAIRRRLDDLYGMGGILNNQGVVYNDRGDLERAKALLEEALVVAEQLGNKQLRAQVFLNLARNAIYDEALDEALVYNEKALKQFEEVGDSLNSIAALYNSVEIYMKKQNWDQVNHLSKRGMNLSDQIGYPVEQFLKYQGIIAHKSKDYSKSLSIFLTILKSNLGLKIKFEILAMLSEMFLEIGAEEISFNLSVFISKHAESEKLRAKAIELIETLPSYNDKGFKKIKDCVNEIENSLILKNIRIP